MYGQSQGLFEPFRLALIATAAIVCWSRVACITINRHTNAESQVALTIDAALLGQVDALVAQQRFRNRSQAVEAALAEKLARLARTRLAQEAAKLDPVEERQLAEEGLAAAGDAWPEY